MPAPEERRRVARAYDRYRASTRKQRAWSADNPGNAAIRAELVETVFALAGPALRAAEEILDVGCGSGWWLEQLAERQDAHARLHGVEILPERVEAARRRAVGATVTVADARALPYPDDLFQVVSLFTVLSSLSDRGTVARVLAEAWRVLAPGGVLLVWEPRIPNPFNPRTTMVTLRVVTNALPEASIEVRTTTVLPVLARRLGSRTARLYPRLARIGLVRTHQLIAVRRPPGATALT